MSPLHVAAAGDPASPAVMLVHAFGTDGRFWDEVVPALSGRYRCLVPDLRNAGRTGSAGRPVLPAEHCADLLAVVRDAGLQRVAWVGCAIGGMLAALAAAEDPGLAAGLVMANPGVRNAASFRPAFRQRAEQVRAGGMGVLLPATADRVFNNLPKDARYDRYRAQLAAQDPETYALSVLGFADIDIADALPRLRCPVLLMPGGNDVLMAPDSAENALALAPHAQLAPLAEGGHFIPFQQPEQFLAAAQPFLATCLGA